MISINIKTPQELQHDIAQSIKTKRLALNLSQQSLSAKSGVSYGVLKKFERTGQISLESLLKIALVLGLVDNFNSLFVPDEPTLGLSLDELMKDDTKNTRKRGRK